MAKSFDDLIDWLLGEIVFGGDQGEFYCFSFLAIVHLQCQRFFSEIRRIRFHVGLNALYVGCDAIENLRILKTNHGIMTTKWFMDVLFTFVSTHIMLLILMITLLRIN